MDACARIRGVPLRTRASIRKETVRDSGTQCVKSLLRNRKELCSVVLELHAKDMPRLTEIHFVCLPGHSEGEESTLQAVSSLPGEMSELLKSLHVASLRNDEVLLLRDSRRLADRKDSGTQCWLKAVCVLRHGPGPQASVAALVGLLGRYVAGLHYALELQALHRGAAEACQAEEDDTNQSVSSIEDDFVTALEHLEEEDGGGHPASGPYHHGNQRDVASQTVPAHKRRKDLSGSRVIISSFSKKACAQTRPGPELSSITVQRSSGVESQWTLCSPGARRASPSAPASDSEESDGSSPSPIIFLDEVGYQRSLQAKLDIPQVPGGPRERVEDSDSEVSEFFDSFDQFDDMDDLSSESGTLTLPLDLPGPATAAASSSAPAPKSKPSAASSTATGTKYVSRGCSTKGMNPHRFDHPTLPANVKKPTPLKPGSPYSARSEVPDSPRPARSSCEESGGPLFSPVSASAFSPLGDSGPGALEYFWKSDGDEGSELRKPQDLCSLYKTYSDFASSLSKEILGSVCGYQSPLDMSDNKNLSCVCHKEFQNPSGHLMKLSEIQETVSVARLQPQSLKEGIQRLATELVEMSLGSALRDLQKGVSSCTTTLCHLAARLTSSVFQMAFQEIGMRRAYVLKERAVHGLAGFLVSEAVSGALQDFLAVKKQIFNGTVTRFAAELAEELVFEGMMEVCQFSHPSSPLSPHSDWSFGRGLEEEGEGEDEEEEEEEEVVTSYASDLSESVLQEAFIELSQADVAFTSQAAISVSLDNVYYVSAEDMATHACNASASHAPPPAEARGFGEECGCTVQKALFSVSGMASCVPVPQAGQALVQLPAPGDACVARTSQSSPTRCSSDSEGPAGTSPDTTAATQTDLEPQGHGGSRGDGSQGKSPFHNFSGNMVDMIVSEACELITATKVKKTVGDCADFLSKTMGGRRRSSARQDSLSEEGPDSPCKHGEGRGSFRYEGQQAGVSEPEAGLPALHHTPQTDTQSLGRGGCEPSLQSKAVAETRPVMVKDTLGVPGSEAGGRKMSGTGEDSSPGSGHKSGGTPGTPPSTPQQPSLVSKERQIKQFSKKLKSKLAKEFSPATPPSTPHYQPEPGPGPREATPEKDKADFLLKLMRSLSEEADGNEEDEEEEEEEEDDDEEEEEEAAARAGGETGRRPELNLSTARLRSSKEALHYAERLACHIVSMATEMDTLGGLEEGEGERRGSVAAHFSEQTLNTLWVYAGEVAGDVVGDVKRMAGPGQQPHHPGHRRHHHHHHYHHHDTKKPGAGPLGPSEHSLEGRVARVAEQWSSDLLASTLQPAAATAPSPGSGLSSDYPSCESVTDEYAGYLIRVLKKEGGSRELVLDQYASRLAYRSIKLGLAHAARKMKQRASRLHPARRSLSDAASPREEAGAAGAAVDEAGQCSCGKNGSRREYKDLVNFAESLAFNITMDVTRKLCVSSVRLPKSLTDSCLYKKSKLEGVAENVIRSSVSCPLLAKEGGSRQYHSTGSLCDAGYSSGVMQVIEHYARKIVDDTLELSLASASRPAGGEHQRAQGPDRHSHTERLSQGAAPGLAVAERPCPYCSKPSRQHQQGPGHRRRRLKEAGAGAGADRLCGLEIPEIHIDLDHRAAFAEGMVSAAMETAKRELSNTSLNADSGIGHDGASYAESLTAEIMTSALSNACQTAHRSPPGREATESIVSQQLSLSVGDDSLGSWSNLSFEDEHADESSSFLHLSDSSNGNSSSWSSLGLEGEVCEERLSFSPSDSDCAEDKESEVKEESCGTVRVERPQPQAQRGLLVVVNSEVRGPVHEQHAITLDPQLRSMLQWAAASMADLPQVQLGPSADRELQQLPAVVQSLREREWRVGELLQALLRYCEETQAHAQLQPTEEPSQAGRGTHRTPLFQWLLEHA